MAKSNGKAKRNGKAKKERMWFEVSMVPFKHQKLTPERALDWMNEEYEGYHDLAMDGQRYATDEADRDAFHNLAFSVARMVEACQAAIETGEVVYLEGGLHEELKSGRFEFLSIRGYLRVLRFRSVIVGTEVIITEAMHNALESLFEATLRYVDAGAKVEHEKWGAEVRADCERKRRRMQASALEA